MDLISVTMVDVDTYEVFVDKEVQTTHLVRLSPAHYKKLSGGQFTHEWVIVQAFQFLLERESNTSILDEFDVADINRYFPEFETEIERRLIAPR